MESMRSSLRSSDVVFIFSFFFYFFSRLDSPKRQSHLAGGGVHGNAILSRFPIKKSGAWAFKKQAYDWTKSASQPRRGARCVVWADLEYAQGQTFRVYSAHLENYCGCLERLEQLLEIVDHVPPGNVPVCIAGDLNTLMHGVIRWLLPLYPSKDWMLRFWTSLGVSEAEFWEKNFQTPESATEFAKKFGLDAELCRKFSLFRDFFPKNERGSTFVNTLFPWINFYAAKLDWLLFSPHFVEVGSEISGEGLSDHLCVATEVTLK
jgi:endonuclease/exonuclease/phosphatase family metal-dependent hydrolase